MFVSINLTLSLKKAVKFIRLLKLIMAGTSTGEQTRQTDVSTLHRCSAANHQSGNTPGCGRRKACVVVNLRQEDDAKLFHRFCERLLLLSSPLPSEVCSPREEEKQKRGEKCSEALREAARGQSGGRRWNQQPGGCQSS